MHPHLLHCGKGTTVPIEGTRIAITNHVHEISDHCRAGESAGLGLETIDEVIAPVAWAEASPNYHGLGGHPLSVSLLFRRH